ncbi:MAG: metallophosphoesterase [Sphingobacteriaceae bacterium]
MTSQLFTLIPICIGLLLVDFYILDGIRAISSKFGIKNTKRFKLVFWITSLLLVCGLFVSIYFKIGTGLRAAILLVFFLLLVAKIFFLPFIIVDDVRRIFLWLARKYKKPEPEFPASQPKPNHIPRSEFLMKAGLVMASLPLASLSYGIISGAYDYRIRRQVLYFPNLPKAFEGIRLGQLSDIHSGSFYNKTAVLGGVEMLLKEKPDFVFFTGDLVNNVTSEIKEYFGIFSKVKAPLGVYSVLGNHDYGDYHRWPNDKAKRKNLEDMLATHKNLGWDLLMNEHRRLKVDGEEIGILGVENWGQGRFPKYGRMDLAVKNADDLPVKLLLSHDPAHWRGQVLDQYSQIDAVFSGHTHGMQFGIKTEHFQWSPIQYVYKEWSGLYQEKKQQLYVNVGYGFLGYPGRVGILPEITIFELKRG